MWQNDIKNSNSKKGYFEKAKCEMSLSSIIIPMNMYIG